MKSEKVLIFGYGQIGNLYQKFFSDKNIESKIAKDVDITKFNDVRSSIEKYDPTTVINTAAKTNLEWCSKNKVKTFEVNVLGADNIAKVCEKKNIYFIHFSSGCIFESKAEGDAKKEDDVPNPCSYYAWTKVWAEQMIRFEKSRSFKYLILRPRQPISTEFSYKNMLVKMLTFAKFIDTPNTLTVLEDLLDWTLVFLEQKPVGILHVANAGWITPYQIGVLLKKHILPTMKFEKILKEDLDELTPNKRVDTILNIEKLKSLGVQVSSCESRIENVIVALNKNLKSMSKKDIGHQLDKTLQQSRARTITNDDWKNLLE